MYRLKYWYQETDESGRWCLTGIMTKEEALKMLNIDWYENAEIIPDEDYAICKNCAYRVGEDCELHCGRECYMEDTCDEWQDKNI